MNRHGNRILAIATLCFPMLVASPVRAAALTKVSQSDWWGTVSGLPSYVNMHIYVPDKPATKPLIVVAAHYCTGTASAYFGSVSTVVSAANNNGFIMIFPEATGRNCWDVGSTASLTHDGKGDTHAIAQMVRYTLAKYSADASRVYAFGGSSGAMMTQALMGVYPDIFMAGVEFAGVPCGCWADGYDQGGTAQWSNNCAGGKTTKTAQQWGELVRSMYPSYTGHRPRLQLWHGTADTTIDYNNFLESIKEWTNVLGLSTTPTTTDTPKTNYNHQTWKNACGFTVLDTWAIQNGGHNIPFDGNAVISFLGLDKTGQDPETAACSGDGGVGGTGGVSGTGGTTGAGGTGGARDGGPGGSDVVQTSTGGVQGSAGNTGGGGVSGTGGSIAVGSGGIGGIGGIAGNAGNGGSPGTGGGIAGGGNSAGGASSPGGTIGTGGNVGGGGSSAKGGSGGEASGGTPAIGGTSGQGGNSGSGGSTPTAGNTSTSGCGCALGTPVKDGSALALLFAVLGLVLHRRTRAKTSPE